jgi:hypothetical protein
VFAFKWRVHDLRDIAGLRSFGTNDPVRLSFKARIVRSPFSLPRKYDAHLSNSAADALTTLRAHDPTLSNAHRTFHPPSFPRLDSYLGFFHGVGIADP